MAVFISADFHLGDDRLHLLRRPFNTVEDMEKVIYREINKVVGPDDTLLIVGDVTCKKVARCPDRLYDKLSEMWDNLICHNWELVYGNHDIGNIDIYHKFFRDPREFMWYYMDDSNGNPLHLMVVHDPAMADINRFNLVGHVHGAWRVQKNMLNVGLDTNWFRPYSEDDIRFMMTAIRDHYDSSIYPESRVSRRWCDDE